MNIKEQEWEKKLVREFGSVLFTGTEYGFAEMARLKDFISKALQEQRTSIIKEIEKQRDKYDQDDMIKYQALDDIIKEINK